jgi:hypothetical protein
MSYALCNNITVYNNYYIWLYGYMIILSLDSIYVEHELSEVV